ncbi:MAG: hypothetical protein Q6K90_05260 [Gloeomargarita sp. HHBFW_bins_162]
MQWFNRIIMPLLLVLTFGIALVAVTARSFLPGDMAAPAPTGFLLSQAVVHHLLEPLMQVF